MAVPFDNPSYFSVSGGLTSPTANKTKFTRLFKKKAVSTTIPEPEFFKSATINNRRQIRSLLRSVSTNSAESNQELLVLGEPRPSDIAPASPCLTHKKSSTRRSSDMDNDLIHCTLALEENGDTYSEEEVFLSEDSARYYNISGTKPGRRHSIGTYLNNDRERTLSVASTSKSCLEEAIVHANADGEIARTSSMSGRLSLGRRHRYGSRKPDWKYGIPSNCPVGIPEDKSLISCFDIELSYSGGLEMTTQRQSSTVMDDILIVSSLGSEASTLWVDYFASHFESVAQNGRPMPRILKLGLEDITINAELTPSMIERISSAKLQMIIVCPRFLEIVEEYPTQCSTFDRCLKPERTIAMLLGVTDENLSEIHNAALPSYMQWQRHIGQDRDPNFTIDFVKAAMSILTRVTRQQQQQAFDERTSFSVMPKKVKHSNNRMVILLSEPLARDDVVKVSVDKNGDMIEIKNVKRRNPYTLKMTMPDTCLEVSALVKILVEKNGDLLGARPVKCESRLRELDQLLRTTDNPLEFMCQTLGFSPTNRDQLDMWMVHNFQKNVPPDFHLLSHCNNNTGMSQMDSAAQTPTPRHTHGHEEYPTLMHFAAKFGLEKLVWQLLECPGGEEAMEIRNVRDLTPKEIAEEAGHTKVANTFSGYMQMNALDSMYTKVALMQNMHYDDLAKNKDNEPEVDEDMYLKPKSCNLQNYSIPPVPKPVIQVTNIENNKDNSDAGYMKMNPTGRKLSASTGTLPKIKTTEEAIQNSATQAQMNKFAEMLCNTKTNLPPKYETKAQEELIEIIRDFKENIFQIAEVEDLVNKWRNRKDVRKSFQEREEQLNEMRRQYELIQQKMKEEKPTRFERFLKFFSSSSKAKSVDKDKITLPNQLSNEEKVGNYLATNNLRPISSLSLQSTTSTSSSGRCSTYSSNSFGDSGTHSDHEERKLLMRQTSNASDHDYFEIGEKSNYMIPPAPRPVNKYSQMKTFHPQNFKTINERSPFPLPRIETPPISGEHYIQFPPSGRPINADLQTQRSQSPNPLPPPDATSGYLPTEEQQPDYLNINPQETHSLLEEEVEYLQAEGQEQDQDDQHEYMNLSYPKNGNRNQRHQEMEPMLPNYMNITARAQKS